MREPVEMVETTICGRWKLLLPEHRKLRHVELPYWEKPRLDSMHANLRPGDVLYDVGTEEGDLSALFAQWVFCDCLHDDPEDLCPRPGGIVLVEPNPKVWPNIRAIWEANGLPDPLACWVGFLGATHRDQPADGAWGGGIAYDGWPRCAHGPLIGDHGFLNLHERPEVPVVTVDSVAGHIGRPPTAITMDVEGSELSVLRGASSTLRDHRPLVWISVHPDFERDMYDETPAMVAGFLDAHGYRVEHLAAEHEWHWFAYPEERDVVLPYGGTS